MNEIFLTVVIPAYNEAARLPISLQKVLTFLEGKPFSSEVIVVDDGSDDGTARSVELVMEERDGTLDNSVQNPKCRLCLVKNDHRGKGFAVRSGMLKGQGKFILFTDADLSTPVEDADKLLYWLEKGVDLAVGSREGEGAHRYGEPFYRHMMGRVFNLVVRIFTGIHLQDTQCGFKAFSREAAYDIFNRVRLYGEKSGPVKGAMVTGFDVEVLFLAYKKGYRVKEVPVQWFHAHGSKVNPLRDSARMMFDIVKVRLNDLRGKYKVNS
jgi:dolichyl-phosphate beta-glucosyltransferase